VDIVVEVAPEVYKSYFSKDNKRMKQLLVQYQNDLHDTMDTILLYYRKFVKSFTDIDFVINPYDLCMANKKIEGEQITICVHDDDCNHSHLKTKVMDSIVNYLLQEYESIFEDGSGAMTVSRGNTHKYLVMTLDYTVRGQVKITMFNYDDEFIAAFNYAELKGGGTKSSAGHGAFSKSMRAVKISSKTRMWSSTTLWRRYCILPSGSVRTPTPQSHY
jgi:hypothetical protein